MKNSTLPEKFLSQKKLLAIPQKNNEQLLLPIRKVLYVQSSGNYVWLYYKQSKKTADKILLCKRLGEVQQLLEPYGIIRLHKSFLVNNKRVKKINFVSRYVVMQLTGDSLHYTPNYQHLIKKLFAHFL